MKSENFDYNSRIELYISKNDSLVKEKGKSYYILVDIF
jgi:hypothetical protein